MVVLATTEHNTKDFQEFRELYLRQQAAEYLRLRYYHPDTGTFSKLDPFAGEVEDPQSLHKYTYVHGDPVNAIDPTGEFAWFLYGLVYAPLALGFIGAVGFSLWGLALGPQAGTLAAQTPANLTNTSVLYHSAIISGSRWSLDKTFDEVTSFRHLPASEIVAYNSPRQAGDIVTFGITNWKRLGQRDFRVQVVQRDKTKRLMVVETMDGHPLEGWRAWQVSRTPNGDTLVETWSVDQPNGTRNRYKFELGGDEGQNATWKGMLRNLAKDSGGKIVAGQVDGRRDPKGQLGNFYTRMGSP